MAHSEFLGRELKWFAMELHIFQGGSVGSMGLCGQLLKAGPVQELCMAAKASKAQPERAEAKQKKNRKIQDLGTFFFVFGLRSFGGSREDPRDPWWAPGGGRDIVFYKVFE